LALTLSDYAYVIAEGRLFAEARLPRWRPCRTSAAPISGFKGGGGALAIARALPLC